MDWSTVYKAQDDSLESMLARQQVNNSVVLKVAQELDARKNADRSFGLQQDTLKENTAYRKSQQESLDKDRAERGEDRDENRKLVKTQRFLTGLSLRKKGDPVNGADQVQFAQEGMAGLNKPAGPDDHEAGPHWHFGGTAAQEDADARQASADSAQASRERHEREMERLGGITAAAATTRANQPSGGGNLSANQEVLLTNKLRADYNKLSSEARTMKQQQLMMQSGLEAFNRGDRNAATQAIISTFNKIMDPNSVVRESEYDRSPQGMALLERIKGYGPMLQNGGVGMTAQGLQEFKTLADQWTTNAVKQMETMTTPIFAQAAHYGIDPSFIKDGGAPAQAAAPGAAPAVATPSGQPAAAPAPGGAVNYRFNPQTGKLEKVGG